MTMCYGLRLFVTVISRLFFVEKKRIISGATLVRRNVILPIHNVCLVYGERYDERLTPTCGTALF